MRNQVRSLLAAFPGSLLAAPEDVLTALGDLVPDPADRCADLPTSSETSGLIAAGARVGWWAKRRGATLLHGHGLRWSPLFASASGVSGLPLIVTLHNLVPADLSVKARLALRATLGRARRILCVSEAVAASARQARLGLPLERLVVVRNGIDTACFAAAADSLLYRFPVRASLSLPPDAPVALCVARLSPEKGVGTFLEACALLIAAKPQGGSDDARFVVAGDGPLRATLLRQRTLLGLEDHVSLLGARSDVPELLSASDVFCQPSYEEGLGLAVIEAMAAGLPVVATRVGGLPEVVRENETGLLVPPRDPPALARALEALLFDPVRARAFGEAGRARAQAHFTEAAMIAATRAVYDAAAAARQR